MKKIVNGVVSDMTPSEVEEMTQLENSVEYTEKLTSIMKARRDSLLKESDFTQIPDYPITSIQKQAWADYRQALRDVPQQEGFPSTITWPTKPA